MHFAVTAREERSEGMGKYIIDIEHEDMIVNGHLVIPLEVCVQGNEEKIKFNCELTNNLTPYTEPDFDTIRKQAYEQGRKDGKIEGQAETWECARKIIHMPEADLLNLFDECYAAVCTSVQVFLKYDVSECIEKIRQYEQAQEEIKVGDEVIAASGKAVIIDINDNKDKARYIYSDSTLGFGNICNLSKTGRHFHEIAEVLQKMKES
jgi:hypothetical protein